VEFTIEALLFALHCGNLSLAGFGSRNALSEFLRRCEPELWLQPAPVMPADLLA